MDNILGGMVTGEQLVVFLILAFIVGFFIYKEYPELKKRMTAGTTKEQQMEAVDKGILERLDAIEEKLAHIEARLSRDYNRINDMEREGMEQKRLAKDSLEERQIIMRGLLGALGGLQELGANGPTKASKKEIEEYLIKSAHRTS